ncbi:MAG: ABC transporter ATP-binding protein [Planctomycetota bacterium]
MIRIEHLGKDYGRIRAIDDLTLLVEPGQVFALLGPNGAGKSTTIKCMMGLLSPDRGTIELDGVDVRTDPARARRRVSYVPEVAHVYDALTPWEYLHLRGRLFELDDAAIDARTERLLRGFGLYERRDQPMAAFSKGMTQKTVLASALLTEPHILILDEPLSGLDVETTMLVKEVMRQFAARGGTLLYSSHMLDVVERIADRVAVIDRGGLRAVGSVQELRQQAGADGERRLEQLFAELTHAGDPVARAKELLGG